MKFESHEKINLGMNVLQVWSGVNDSTGEPVTPKKYADSLISLMLKFGTTSVFYKVTTNSKNPLKILQFAWFNWRVRRLVNKATWLNKRIELNNMLRKNYRPFAEVLKDETKVLAEGDSISFPSRFDRATDVSEKCHGPAEPKGD